MSQPGTSAPGVPGVERVCRMRTPTTTEFVCTVPIEMPIGVIYAVFHKCATSTGMNVTNTARGLHGQESSWMMNFCFGPCVSYHSVDLTIRPGDPSVKIVHCAYDNPVIPLLAMTRRESWFKKWYIKLGNELLSVVIRPDSWGQLEEYAAQTLGVPVSQPPLYAPPVPTMTIPAQQAQPSAEELQEDQKPVPSQPMPPADQDISTLDQPLLKPQ